MKTGRTSRRCANRNRRSTRWTAPDRSRALHGCANRNWITALPQISPPCRTLRGCVNRNGSKSQASRQPIRRTSRGCANRNISIFHTLPCNRGRTLHGCANRNLANAIILAIQMSHPTRVRESKLYIEANLPLKQLSHLTRVRESKSAHRYTTDAQPRRTSRGCANRNRVRTAYPRGRKVAPHAGASRNKSRVSRCQRAWSRTFRRCANRNSGLFCVMSQTRAVAPCTGARIEITLTYSHGGNTVGFCFNEPAGGPSLTALSVPKTQSPRQRGNRRPAPL